jgi:hypothetical protein
MRTIVRNGCGKASLGATLKGGTGVQLNCEQIKPFMHPQEGKIDFRKWSCWCRLLQLVRYAVASSSFRKDSHGGSTNLMLTPRSMEDELNASSMTKDVPFTLGRRWLWIRECSSSLSYTAVCHGDLLATATCKSPQQARTNELTRDTQTSLLIR